MVSKQMHKRITQRRRAFSVGRALLLIGAIALGSAPAAFGDTHCAESGLFTIDTGGIPAMSLWGIAAMTLLTLTAGTVVIRRSRVALR